MIAFFLSRALLANISFSELLTARRFVVLRPSKSDLNRKKSLFLSLFMIDSTLESKFGSSSAG